jgi:enoyl-CoA hydratase
VVSSACDLTVAARDARFGLPEVTRGLAAAAGGLLRLPRFVPQRIAMQMALTGDHVDASFLERHGLINQLVEPGEALAAAQALAARIARNAPLAVAASKWVILEQRNWSDRESFDRQSLTRLPGRPRAAPRDRWTAGPV